MRWLKGLEYAVVAIRQLVDAEVRVRLDVFGGDQIGEASERERLLYAIADLGLQDHVRLHGHVPSSRLVAELQRSDVLLHASLTEGIPTVVLEAMACAIPVVVTDCGGVRDAVTDGVEGFVLPPRAPRELATALQALWGDPALRRRMGIAGRVRVQQHFSLDQQLEHFVDLYQRVSRRRLPKPESGGRVPRPVRRSFSQHR